MNTTDLERKLEAVESRYDELTELMASPDTLQDPSLLQRYGREHAALDDVVRSYRSWREVRQEIAPGTSIQRTMPRWASRSP